MTASIVKEIEINKPITVAEFIKLLSELPQDGIVCTESGRTTGIVLYDDNEVYITG